MTTTMVIINSAEPFGLSVRRRAVCLFSVTYSIDVSCGRSDVPRDRKLCGSKVGVVRIVVRFRFPLSISIRVSRARCGIRELFVDRDGEQWP